MYFFSSGPPTSPHLTSPHLITLCRQQNLTEAKHLKSQGRYREASTKFLASVKVTKQMVNQVASAVKAKFGGGDSARVKCLFSPYEADSQLAKLCVDGFADAVVTEDSDLLVYSASCGVPFPIIFKLDRDGGACEVICLDWFLIKASSSSSSSSPPPSSSAVRPDYNLLDGVSGQFAGLLRFMTKHEQTSGHGRRMFVQACLMAGCDYVPSLPGVGIVNAFKMVRDFATTNGNERIKHILRAYRGMEASKKLTGGTVTSDDCEYEGDTKIVHDPAEYEALVLKAEFVFFHHLVLDVTARSVVPLQRIYSSDENDDKSKSKQLAIPDFRVMGKPSIDDIIGIIDSRPDVRNTTIVKSEFVPQKMIPYSSPDFKKTAGGGEVVVQRTAEDDILDGRNLKNGKGKLQLQNEFDIITTNPVPKRLDRSKKKKKKNRLKGGNGNDEGRGSIATPVPKRSGSDLAQFSHFNPPDDILPQKENKNEEKNDDYLARMKQQLLANPPKVSTNSSLSKYGYNYSNVSSSTNANGNNSNSSSNRESDYNNTLVIDGSDDEEIEEIEQNENVDKRPQLFTSSRPLPATRPTSSSLSVLKRFSSSHSGNAIVQSLARQRSSSASANSTGSNNIFKTTSLPKQKKGLRMGSIFNGFRLGGEKNSRNKKTKPPEADSGGPKKKKMKIFQMFKSKKTA